MKIPITRRKFLAAGAMALATGCSGPSKVERHFTGGMKGPSASVGHLLRGELPASPSKSERKRVVVVGGGIAGLSAARRLKQRGMHDFVLLELENHTGGNSSVAEGPVSPAPWGAHYVPLPSLDCKSIIELFRDLGVITGFDAKGLPIYNEFHLCSEPVERLFIHGRWQEGLSPNIGVTAADRRQFEELSAAMDHYRVARGQDGKRAFAIPVDESSTDDAFRVLDAQRFSDWLDERGWKSEPLRWYADYCCLDDYGARASEVSAWAGIHYFASRDGAASNATGHSVVTWPEGNGWLVNRMADALKSHIACDSLVYRITQNSNSAYVDVLNAHSRETRRYEAAQVIFCGPRFVAHRVLEELRPSPCPVKEYAPWMVANLTVKQRPTGAGGETAWDNVFYDSPSLGYVVATHQVPSRAIKKTVLTYYLPLCDAPAAEARRTAHDKTYAQWCDLILADMEKVHPGITTQIENLDVRVWGHGMVTPTPNFIWGEVRRAMFAPIGRVHFAHSDMSGISIFEEAYLRGQTAADQALEELT